MSIIQFAVPSLYFHLFKISLIIISFNIEIFTKIFRIKVDKKFIFQFVCAPNLRNRKKNRHIMNV